MGRIGDRVDGENMPFSCKKVISIMNPMILIKYKVKVFQRFSEEITVHTIIFRCIKYPH